MRNFSPEQKAYRPYGAALEAMYAKENEVLLAGMAGTGKSRGILEKIHICCEKYEGCRILLTRKTRASMTESVLVTFEDFVIPTGHPILLGATRGHRQSYVYPNGSTIVVAGMDKPSKILSTEFDLIYPQEAIELSVDDWETLTTRLRYGKMPYQQIIGDTNPDKPTHWLKQRCDSGKTRLITCLHEDNPVLYDHAKNEWTARGKEYIARLDNLTGPRKQRLRFGKWVMAEGVVYEEYDSQIHRIARDKVEITQEWERIWVIDFGYVNPFVWHQWAVSPFDGSMYLEHQIYHTKRTVEEHCDRIMKITKRYPNGPTAVICDHDAEDRATVEEKTGVKTTAANKAVSMGIDKVKERFKDRRLFFLYGSLDQVDKELEEAKKPTCTEDELDGYCWKVTDKQHKGDEPEKKDDHGADATRYGVMYYDGRPEMRFY